MNRIRVEAPIDKDAISPDSVAAAQVFLTGQMFERANNMGVALDWTTFTCYSRIRRKSGDLVLVQWAKIAR